ncbi:MAG: tetratricopeptide repeat protein [Gemmataceae bacterium]|nr:tetratricopeptide repeat protein [Gemmataceae bacterium]
MSLPKSSPDPNTSVDPNRTLDQPTLPSQSKLIDISQPIPPSQTQMLDISQPIPPSQTQMLDISKPEHRTAVTQTNLPKPPPEIPTIPGYRITAEIARGGMGCVYAGFDLSLDREVAIKTLLPNANAERFVTEAKITARLPHPNIPPVHALGSVEGTPWLAMKLVHGRTLAELLKQRHHPKDDLPRFLLIFEQIAQAVGFAHSRGIIHRDLKPMNVMVGEFGEVQVMDWGLAKELPSRDRQETESPSPLPPSPAGRGEVGIHALRNNVDVNPSPAGRGEGGEGAEHTAAGTVMGTPGYMAPEQARGQIVDARADVFALGSVLAAILTGRPAFVGDTVRETIAKAAQADLAEVRERLAYCGADAELLAVAFRCLSANPEERYADGREVASAIAAYRADVEARLRQAETEKAQSETRAVEQAKRRRVVQWAAGGIAVVLLAGLGISLWQMKRANAERDAKEIARQAEAEAAENERLANQKEQAARVAAEKRLKQVGQGVELIAKILREINPNSEDPSQPALYDRLRIRALEAARSLDEDAVADSSATARLRVILGQTLLSLGETSAAIEQLEKAEQARITLANDTNDEFMAVGALNAAEQLGRAYAIAGRYPEAIARLTLVVEAKRKSLGPDDPLTHKAMTELGHAALANGMTKDAVTLFEHVYQSKLGTKETDSVNLSMAAINLASARLIAGDVTNTTQLLEESRQKFEAKLGSEHVQTLQILMGLGRCYHRERRFAEAIALFEKVLEVRKAKLGEDHPETLMTMADLAQSYDSAGRKKEAVELGEQVVARRTVKLGSEHVDTLNSKSNLATTYQRLGRYADSAKLDEEVLAVRQKKLGANHPDTLLSINNLATALSQLKRYEESIRLYEEAYPRMVKEMGADHPHAMQMLHNLADLQLEAGQLEQAIVTLEKVREARIGKLGIDSLDTAHTSFSLAKALHQKKKYLQAVELAEQVYEVRRKTLGDTHGSTLTALAKIASIRFDMGDSAQAVKLYEQVRLALDKTKPTDPTLFTVIHNLGVGYYELGKIARSVELLEKAVELRRQAYGAEHPDTLDSVCALGAVYRAANLPQKSVDLLEPALSQLRKSLGEDHPSTLTAANNLAGAYRNLGKLPQALELFQSVYERRAKILSPENHQTLITLNNLALTYQESGKLKEAIEAFEKCRKGLIKSLPADHNEVLNTSVNLAIALKKSGKPTEALRLLEEIALLVEKRRYTPPSTTTIIGTLIKTAEEQEQYARAEVWRKKWITYGKSLPDANPSALAIELFNLAECQGNQDKWSEAETTYREAAELVVRIDPDLWTNWLIKARIGETLLEQKKYTDAEKLLLEGYEGLKKREAKIPKSQDHHLPETAKALIKLYKAMEKPDEVKKWIEIRNKYPFKTF